MSNDGERRSNRHASSPYRLRWTSNIEVKEAEASARSATFAELLDDSGKTVRAPELSTIT